MKRILIDGRFVGVGDSIARYVLELLGEILKIDTENNYTLLIRPVGRKKVAEFFAGTYPPNLKIKILDIAHYSVSEQTKLLKYLNREKFDLVHFTQFNHPVFYRGKFITTIHDLTLIGHLHRFNPIKRFAYNLVMRDAARRSQRVIAISKMTKQDVIDYYGTQADKFAVIYHGIDHEQFKARIQNTADRIQQFKKDNGIAGNYILYTGMWKKHKNLKRLFEAFEKNTEYRIQNIAKQLQLVLVGKIDTEEPEILVEIDKINITLGRKAILAIGPRYGEELTTAYAGALLYVIPSLSEGFGWPPLEAMACGVPVAASKESCIPEILGDAPLYFDPYDVDDIAKAIEKIVSDDKLRQQLIAKGLKQVEKYNWSETAKKTLAVYQSILK